MRPVPGIEITTHVGGAILAVVDELAHLRIAIFRDWPYLYDGDPAYERDYLAAYAASPRSICVSARTVAGDIVGASTGLPLVDEGEALQRPFVEAGVDPAGVFYFGESVLLAPWRGRGVGHAFFDAREAHARALGDVRATAFCAVRRDPADSRRPAEYRANDAFWRGRGYAPVEGLACALTWKEQGAAAPTPHVLDVWMRAWNEGGRDA